MSVCLWLFVPYGDNGNRVDWRLLFKEHIAKVAKLITPLLFLRFSEIFAVLNFFWLWGLIFWQTSLLYRVGELAVVGSVAVTVGDRWQMTYDR